MSLIWRESMSVLSILLKCILLDQHWKIAARDMIICHFILKNILWKIHGGHGRISWLMWWWNTVRARNRHMSHWGHPVLKGHISHFLDQFPVWFRVTGQRPESESEWKALIKDRLTWMGSNFGQQCCLSDITKLNPYSFTIEYIWLILYHWHLQCKLLKQTQGTSISKELTSHYITTHLIVLLFRLVN